MTDMKRTSRRKPRGAMQATELDKLIHERIRLGIVSALAAGGALSFTDLKSVLGTTDGNLSVHARKLEDAGYIECRKYFDERTPRTTYELTTAGRAALESYVSKMERIIEAARASQSGQ